MANQFKDLNDDVLKVIAPESPDQLVRDAAHGNLQTVKDILAKYPNVNIIDFNVVILTQKINFFLF
jgi:hypothetical protein